jgi:hypothetical protein
MQLRPAVSLRIASNPLEEAKFRELAKATHKRTPNTENDLDVDRYSALHIALFKHRGQASGHVLELLAMTLWRAS